METIPGGQDKGKPVTEVSDRTLKWWSENAKKESLKRECLAELERRRNGGAPTQPQARPQQGGAVAPASRGELVTGAFRDPQKATDALRAAQEQAHLVAPATVCATLPEGTEIALAAVVVAVGAETYELPGRKLGLAKTALDRIAAAAGIDWDPRLCGRLDDGYDPHYCHYRAVGYVRTFDGSVRTITGEVEIDARDGSPQIEEIETKARKNDRDPRSQVLELRKFLIRHAESKAKNRAIRSLGLRTAYSPEELRKPFIVAKPMFTGASDDPEARREFRTAIADSYLGTRNRLYGGEAAPLREAPARPVSGHRPPPVGSVPPIDADYANVSPRGPYPGATVEGEADQEGPGAIDPEQDGAEPASDIPYE